MNYCEVIVRGIDGKRNVRTIHGRVTRSRNFGRPEHRNEGGEGGWNARHQDKGRRRGGMFGEEREGMKTIRKNADRNIIG